MLETDVMENSCEGFDGMPVEGDYPENLSISLESLIKILDEQPPSPTQITSDTAMGSHHGLLDSVCSDSEPFNAQAAQDNYTESMPSELASEYKSEPWLGHLEQEGSFNYSSGTCIGGPFDNANLQTSQLVKSNDVCSMKSVHYHSWLKLSSADFYTSEVDSHGNPSGSFLNGDDNFRELQNSNTSLIVCPRSAEELGLDYLQGVNNVCESHLDGMKDDLEHQAPEASLVNGYSKSNAQLTSYCNMPQIGETGLALAVLKEACGCIDNSFYDNNRGGTIPDSTIQNENLYSCSRVCAHSDVAPRHDNINPVMNPMEEIDVDMNAMEEVDDLHEGNNSCLIALEELLNHAETVSKPSSPAHAECLSYDREAKLHLMNGKGTQIYISHDSVNSSMLEQFTHSSFRQDPVVNKGAFLSCKVCTQQCYCEETSSKSESSTDSSPLPSSKNTVSLNLDGSVMNISGSLVSDPKTMLQSIEQKNLYKDKTEYPLPTYQLHENISKVAKINAQSTPLRRISNLDDDDAELCILDDISDPVPLAPPLPVLVKRNQPTIPVKSLPVSNHCSYFAGSGTVSLGEDDERLTFQLALQDLSQPKSEVRPPDGLLAVNLLRHQRIALSWMVQKETAGLNCSGGILADDQGLGKTISTIALILTERSPSSVSCLTQENFELKPLNLDDDDNNGCTDVFECNMTRQSQSSGTIKNVRPAAGTLIVCPTSVLRQWAEELANKVTSKANLSYLIYYGSNRTKDPNVLAKFDVVLTTYAIVSMEVPKQLLDDKSDAESRKQDGCSLGNLTCKKRKEPPSRKQENASDSSLVESATRPLAKVRWFRVVLDEAQSIKNHRTQVARACWGLRAKRRWCISGTPIQNAIDDLYSYFRFLRYDPYASYRSFCSAIKMPINRNPTNGYRKLQAVLKTIMLRRTKGFPPFEPVKVGPSLYVFCGLQGDNPVQLSTPRLVMILLECAHSLAYLLTGLVFIFDTLLDGKPIISLPPKAISLKRVDFSEEERNFYLTLEAESREQFKIYANAGTVEQNYVNILLMLLRLRQACDHPLLVKRHESNSSVLLSLEIAKKLPKDRQINLISCLEGDLAICALCNDPPEDAVVAICGHVFCNQCICEHLTGDDHICPSGNCGVKLSHASVFSRGTLRMCISEELDLHSLYDNSITDMEHTPKVCQERFCSNSSKIRAALEILHSLPPLQSSALKSESTKPDNEHDGLSSNAIDAVTLGCSADTVINKHQRPIAKQTEKAIVFSQWTRMLDLLEVCLRDSCILYRRLDGTMSVSARERAVKDFNTLPEITVMIMSLKAASLGLNMVAACHVVLLDLWWNPTTEDQAIDRAHRIGQTHPVTVSRLTVKDTVEDRILALQEKKREMVASAFGEDEGGNRRTRLTVEDLRYLFMV
ncbi:Putative SWI/SNF-related matrix-associated actin-dependent regulator [Apostasia shenzhenica]|uniref:SWI/SNF-related matrix-associated actin-dependent regulator n=1 Tax=Apostasia shenzhenica TaxID=1088818 RepID=A0A2H9ZX71_9ASPA|nr:Putative SWI/SNF-related matrix-associated actin-dependent regulator [Apostasia shenzhenica]